MTSIAYNRYTKVKVSVLVVLIFVGAGFEATNQSIVSSQANIPVKLANGLFAGSGQGHAFDILFEDEGAVTVSGSLGDFSGRWWEKDAGLCVQFDAGPKEGTRCAALTRTGPSQFQIGYYLLIQKLASALRIG